KGSARSSTTRRTRPAPAPVERTRGAPPAAPASARRAALASSGTSPTVRPAGDRVGGWRTPGSRGSWERGLAGVGGCRLPVTSGSLASLDIRSRGRCGSTGNWSLVTGDPTHEWRPTTEYPAPAASPAPPGGRIRVRAYAEPIASPRLRGRDRDP